GPEVDGAGLDLGDAAARADRLVVDLVAGGGVVVGRPLGDQREDEGGAGAGDLRGDLVTGGGRGAGVRAGSLGGGVVGRGAGGKRERHGDGEDGGAERRGHGWLQWRLVHMTSHAGDSTFKAA